MDSAHTVKSVMKFTPTREDNGKSITCKAENPRMRASAKTHIIPLSISCKTKFEWNISTDLKTNLLRNKQELSVWIES